MTRLLILRPEPGASATAARAAALGFEAIPAPLFNIEPRAWPPVDPATLDAVMMTSANAARLGGSLLPAYWHLPLFAVGMATAQAACAAGFSSIHTGAGDVVALAEILRDHGMGRVLHLCGEDHHVPDAPWVRIERRIVYAAQAIDPPPPLPEADFILIHSPRAGARLAEIIPDEARIRHRILAISAAAAQTAGLGWASFHIASAPTDDALLALAANPC